MLVAMGSAATAVARAARIRWVRAAAGVVLVAFGLLQTAHAWAAASAVGGEVAHACCARHR
jgi:hypothetical protein